jgi:hypothetical protein
VSFAGANDALATIATFIACEATFGLAGRVLHWSGKGIKGIWTARKAERAAHAAAVSQARSGLLGGLRNRAVDLAKKGGLIGRNPTKVRAISTGPNRGVLRTDTSLPGGGNAAQSLFYTLTGRAPSGAMDRVVGDGLTVMYRALGKSGHAKLEIVSKAARTHEKITFLK